MDRIYRYLIIISAALLPLHLAAQNLDPTVEVSRAYEGKLVEVHKPSMDVSVPDTVQQFRLDFDYSVFDNPYKGSYEFNPYMASMRPSSAPFDQRTFYLRAGAGYRLQPVADVIWSPAFKKGFRMDVYARNRSYIGDYRNISLVPEGQSHLLGSSGNSWKGRDLRSDVGASGRYEWQKGTFDFDLSYLGIHAKDTLKKRSYNSLNASLGVSSKQSRVFVYDVGLDYGFTADKTLKSVQEHLLSLKADIGPKFRTSHKILFDMGLDMALYAGAIDWGTARMNITPHYVYKKGRWNIDAGVRLDFLVGADEGGAMRSTGRQQFVYPDVNIEFNLVKNAMNIYASAKGGTSLNTYSSIVTRNHFADLSYLRGGVPDSNVERLKAELGLKGRLGTMFSYDLRGGYAGYANTIFDALTFTEQLQPLPSVGYATVQKAFVELDWLLITDRIRFDGMVSLSRYWGFEDASGIFAPSALTGDAAVEYNIRKRLFFAVDCVYASGRRMVSLPSGIDQPVFIPAYADLGVSFEMSVSRKLSFWARGGNLLNMTIQRTPLYAEGGINFTVGICLKL